ncbi:HEAT repeat domain-containing protein [Lysobacter antibioticus]|uniref:HEAT repeat domain-containing protein n=1 Tax=Lysobacter antibioticus TaxID=84531 RepID=UPI0014704762|nr:HEAT repeat domain-containing protein [Lysobacter antibioticus]
MKNDSGTSAVIVTAGDGQDDATRRLAVVLGEHYGMSGRRISYLAGARATGQEIEAGLFQAIRGLRPHDVLFVFVALKLDQADAGLESILVTTDYDPKKPWSGLPTIALRNMASMASAGTLVMIYPDCALGKSDLGYIGKGSLLEQTTEGSSQALISYCPPGDDTGQFERVLADQLAEFAKEPTTRAPWQGKNERGLVSVAAVANRLRETAADFRISAQANAGGGWMRVFTPGSVPPVSAPQLQRELAMAAATDAIAGNDPVIQIEAIQALADAKWPAAQGEFARLLGTSPVAAVRIASARALGLYPNEDSRIALTAAAADSDPGVRVEAMSAIARLGALPAVDTTLGGGLTDSDPRVRAAAVYGLGQQWSIMDSARSDVVASSVAGLVGADPDEDVRAAAAWSLAQGKRTEAVGEVEQLATSQSSTSVRVAAVEALGELSMPGSVSTLVAVAQDRSATGQDMRLRLAAIRSLGKLNIPAAGDTLLALSTDADSTVAKIASSALVDSRALSASALQLAADPDKGAERRTQAIQILGRNDDPESSGVLMELLGDPDVAIRAEATSALGGRSDSAVELGTLLRDPAETIEVRTSAVEALGKMETATAYALLSNAATDPNVEVRAVVATAIGRSFETTKPVDILLQLAGDNSPLVRAPAAKSLGRFTSHRSVRKMLEDIALNDTAPSVREIAVQALRTAKIEAGAPSQAGVTVRGLGRFREEQKKWHIGVFWCEGPGAEQLKRQAETYVAELEKFAREINTETEVISRIDLRPISERTNAFPNYQITQNEIRYESGSQSERKWADRLKIGTGERFVSRPVTKATPGYVSVFLCSAQLADK